MDHGLWITSAEKRGNGRVHPICSFSARLPKARKIIIMNTIEHSMCSKPVAHINSFNCHNNFMRLREVN